jgi:hypothetical protein
MKKHIKNNLAEFNSRLDFFDELTHFWLDNDENFYLKPLSKTLAESIINDLYHHFNNIKHTTIFQFINLTTREDLFNQSIRLGITVGSFSLCTVILEVGNINICLNKFNCLRNENVSR